MIHNQKAFAAGKAYGEDVANRVQRFMPLVRKYAWHLSGSAGPTIEVEDLMQAGLVALTECAQKHDRPTEDGFAAYASMRVRGAMVDLLRSTSNDTRGAVARRRTFAEAESALTLMLGGPPSPHQMAEHLGITEDDYQRQRGELEVLRFQSIDDTDTETDSAFVSQEPTPEMHLLEAQDKAALVSAVSALPERLQMVVQLYFVEELNLSEIADIMDVSVPRVHQLKADALAKLRLAIGE